MTDISMISTEELDRRFDAGEGLEEFFDMDHPVIRRGDISIDVKDKRININMPEWMVDDLDVVAKYYGNTRQGMINVWVGERLRRELCEIARFKAVG